MKKVLKKLCIFTLVICTLFITKNVAYASSSATADTLYGVWEGSYAGSSNGKTVERKIRLDITSSSQLGIFSGVANIDDGKNGTYVFGGTIDFKNNTLEFQGTDWLNNLENYSFAEFSGSLDDTLCTITGLVDNEATKKFVLAKTSSNPKSYAIEKNDLLKSFYGEYDGSKDSTVVRRNMELTFDSVDDDGMVYGTAIVTPSKKSSKEYGVDCSYKIKGKVDLNTGKLVDVQGYEWIKKPNSDFSFIELKGYYDINKNAIVGTSENGIWSLPQSYAIKQTITVNKSVEKTVSIKQNSLKHKARTIKIGAKANTKLTYSVTIGNKKNISVSEKGIITLKKGAQKGIYQVKISAERTNEYKDATKVVTIKVKK